MWWDLLYLTIGFGVGAFGSTLFSTEPDYIIPSTVFISCSLGAFMMVLSQL